MNKRENYFTPPDPDSPASVRTPGYGIAATRTWDGKIRISIGPKEHAGGAQWIFLTEDDAREFIEDIRAAIEGKHDE